MNVSIFIKVETRYGMSARFVERRFGGVQAVKLLKLQSIVRLNVERLARNGNANQLLLAI
jgi:hypothetical protein